MFRFLFPGLLAVLFSSITHAAAPETVRIKTMTAQMKYEVSEIVAAPGAQLKIVFENGDDLPHNIVFCQPGTDTLAMSMKQMENAEAALKRNWLPDDKRIWAHSKMLNPHEKEEFVITVPAKVGSYPFVCTFPGHAMTMRGTLRAESPGEGLRDLRFALYLGAWKTLPDFSKLKPHREGAVPDNLIAVKLDDYKNEFGVVFTGKLMMPRTGSYRFAIASDDGSRLLIDGKSVIENDGIHPSGSIKEKSIKLEKGEHEYRLEYFQSTGQVELFAAWKGADFSVTPLSKWLHPDWKGGGKNKNEFQPIPLVVTSEPVIYRNFIQGAGNRAIGVGYPGGINIAWSAESMNLALMWRGAFIDASKHWNSRGGGHQAPLGYDAVQPTGEVTPAFFVTDKPDAEWPKWDKAARHAGFEWKGYTLDAKRAPTFRYTWHDAEIEESFTTSGDGNKPDGKPVLIRTIKVSGNVPANAWCRIAEGQIEEIAKESFLLNKKLVVSASGAHVAGKNLVMPAKAGEMRATFSWVK